MIFSVTQNSWNQASQPLLSNTVSLSCEDELWSLSFKNIPDTLLLGIILYISLAASEYYSIFFINLKQNYFSIFFSLAVNMLIKITSTSDFIFI